MAKTTPETFINMGFTKEMFFGADNFSAFLAAIIDDIAALLLGRLGSGYYNAVTAPTSAYVKRAEKCLIASELCRLRKVKMIGVVIASGEEPETKALDKQISDYAAEAEVWISRISSGATADVSDFACGTVVTDHFGGTV